MSERKIEVPKRMLKAVVHAAMRDGLSYDNIPIILEAALIWLVEREPTDEEAKLILAECFGYRTNDWERRNAAQYLRTAKEGIRNLFSYMFLAQEPEIPEEVKDLLHPLDPQVLSTFKEHWDRTVLEAYRRGQKAGR